MSAKKYEDDVIPSSPVSRGMEAKATLSAAPQQKGLGVRGLRGKMFGLFFFVPLVLILTASLLYMWQLNALSSRYAQGTSELARVLSEEEALARKVRSVALRLQFYLLAHPALEKQIFNDDIIFRSVALQKVGPSDYTFLYEKQGADGIWSTWAHVNPDFIGSDTTKLRGSLGESYNDFWAIYTSIKDRPEISGYYDTIDEGVKRKKFMVCVSIGRTPYVVAASAYVPKFTNPIKFMQEEAAAFAVRTRNIIIGILAGTLLFVGFVVFTYSYRLAGQIKHLTDIADRISVGDLDIEIGGLQAQDEIGELARAIHRMRESIRLAMKRLRERR